MKIAADVLTEEQMKAVTLLGKLAGGLDFLEGSLFFCSGVETGNARFWPEYQMLS